MNHKDGRTQIGIVTPAGQWQPHSAWTPNQRMATAGYLEAQCLGFRNPAYAISAAYIEFENLSDPTTVIATPTAAIGDTIAYYQGLAGSSTTDFLRVPLSLAPGLGIVAGDEAYFASNQGNLLSYFLTASATTGFFGLPFASGHNSKVYGVALVATPVPGDPTQDILFARAYYTGSNQLLLPTTGWLGLRYDIDLGPTS